MPAMRRAMLTNPRTRANKPVEHIATKLYNPRSHFQEPISDVCINPASEVMLRHSDEFIERRVLFAGDLQDSLPAQFEAADVRVHTQQYHHWQLLNRTMGDNVQFGLTVDPLSSPTATRWFTTGRRASRKRNSSCATSWRCCRWA